MRRNLRARYLRLVMRRTPLVLLACIALPLLLSPAEASAKDLRKKLGVGFNNNFSSLTSISVKFGLPTAKETLNIQIQALGGFGLAPAETVRVFVGGRVLLPVVAEDNLNVYMAAGGGYLGLDTDPSLSEPTGAFRGQAVMGVEFFPFGLDNLGFSAEVGLNIDVGAQGLLSFGTTSGTAASVGVHYYFGKK
ncbi:MAG: hypothetical protein VX498_03710 [Myxococcota bacterium]|nr:hypothetical protein [Myxococcota bacterium]